MKIHKIGIFVFVLLMTVALTACGSGNTASSTTNNTQGNSTTSNGGTDGGTNKTSTNQSNDKKNTDSSDTANAAPVLDLQGRTITIDAWWDPAPDGKTAQSKLSIAQQKKVEKDYDVKIKYVNTPWGDGQKKLVSSALAGKPFADIVRLEYHWTYSDVFKNLLLPLKSYAPDLSKYDHIVPKGQVFGTYYGFDAKGGVGAGGIYYNLDLFKKYNLPDPHQLVKDGKWNWSEFEKLAKEATKDTNGDGKVDTWGLSGWDNWEMLFLLASNDAKMVDDSGKVILSDPKVQECFNFINQLYNVDHVVQIEPKSSPDNYNESNAFKDGKAAMTPSWIWNAGAWKGVNYGFVQFPKGPSGTGVVSPVVNPHAWFIPKGVKNPEAVIQVYNALQNVKSLEDYPGQDYFEQNLKRQVDINSAKLLTQHMVGPRYQNIEGFPLQKLITDVVVKHKDVTSVLKQYQQVAQSTVDKVLHPAENSSK